MQSNAPEPGRSSPDDALLPALLPGLYVVATPIGNLEDLSARAVRVLKTAEIVACEDTRVSRHLLLRAGAGGRSVALHAHNEAQRGPALLDAVADGARVALISDAGTPAVSDPGARLVAAAHARGLAVVPIPGASAVTTLLSAAGLEDGRFRFEGFLPTRTGQRRKRLLALADSEVSLILFEAPHRIEDLARDLAATLEPQRHLVVGRELTKRFEQIASLSVGDFVDWLATDSDRRRGEFVIAIAAAGRGAPLDAAGSGEASAQSGAGEATEDGETGNPAGTIVPAEADGAETDSGEVGESALLPSALGRRTIAILSESMPPRQAARLAARISGDDADLLYRFRAGQRSRDADR